jgi:hypothetical protein
VARDKEIKGDGKKRMRRERRKGGKKGRRRNRQKEWKLNQIRSPRGLETFFWVTEIPKNVKTHPPVSEISFNDIPSSPSTTSKILFPGNPSSSPPEKRNRTCFPRID